MVAMTGSQVRMARAFLRWSLAELAKAANVGISTVQRIEAADDPALTDDPLEWRADARAESVEAIHKTLVAAGVTFLPDDGKGVGLRCKSKRGK
jgi:transcriptional regulator with XRE-family HTH domain